LERDQMLANTPPPKNVYFIEKNIEEEMKGFVSLVRYEGGDTTTQKSKSKAEELSDDNIRVGGKRKYSDSISYQNINGKQIPKPQLGDVFTIRNDTGDASGFVVDKVKKDIHGIVYHAEGRPAIESLESLLMLQVIDGESISLSLETSKESKGNSYMYFSL
jgi:hypothetical protein